jgi:regulator of ribonuclease activity A
VSPKPFATADLVDAHERTISGCSVQFRQYGGRRAFSGQVRTVKTFEDNSVVRATLEQPGKGNVLVVDGGGSLRRALVGDVVAGIGVKSGWSGILIWGCVRDTEALAKLDIGIKALGSNPVRSGKYGFGQVDVEVVIGDARFVPGHWLYSDDDGLIISPSEL